METTYRRREELFIKNDFHWAAERIDLLIHCFFLLERTHFTCEKINSLMREKYENSKKKILTAIQKNLKKD